MTGDRRLFQSFSFAVSTGKQDEVVRKELFHTRDLGGNFPLGQGDISPSPHSPESWEISHS